jgi:lichenan operon transcriptional antiterminator
LPHLSNLSTEKTEKIIHIKNLLNNEEIHLIQQKFFKNSDISKTNIKKFFSKDCFITNKQFNKKEEILLNTIRILIVDDNKINMLLTKTLIQNKVPNCIIYEASTSIFERESASPTEIGNLVAIPHPMVNNTAISSISVLVLDKPIIWVDHHVQVIFLISIAKSEFYFWEPIFLKLFKYLVKENGIKKIINQPNYDDFIKNFQNEFN